MTEVHRNIKLVVWCHDKSPFRSEKPISTFGPVQLLTILTFITSLILFNFGNLYLFKTYLKKTRKKENSEQSVTHSDSYGYDKRRQNNYVEYILFNVHSVILVKEPTCHNHPYMYTYHELYRIKLCTLRAQLKTLMRVTINEQMKPNISLLTELLILSRLVEYICKRIDNFNCLASRVQNVSGCSFYMAFR